MNLEHLKSEAAAIQWEDLMSTSNLDLANNLFKEKINSLMDRIAPWKTFLPRRQYRNWLSLDTKLKMEKRDKLKEETRLSQSELKLSEYKVARNFCSKLVKKDINELFERLYSRMEDEHDTKGTYSALEKWEGTLGREEFRINTASQLDILKSISELGTSSSSGVDG